MARRGRVDGGGGEARRARKGGLTWGNLGLRVRMRGVPWVWVAVWIRWTVSVAVRLCRVRVRGVRAAVCARWLLGGRRCRDILCDVVLIVGLLFWRGRVCAVVGGRLVGKVERLERGKTKVVGRHVRVGRVRVRVRGVVLVVLGGCGGRVALCRGSVHRRRRPGKTSQSMSSSTTASDAVYLPMRRDLGSTPQCNLEKYKQQPTTTQIQSTERPRTSAILLRVRRVVDFMALL